MLGGIAPGARIGELLVGEHAPEEPILPALHQAPDPGDLDDVDADPEDQSRSSLHPRPLPHRGGALLVAPGPGKQRDAATGRGPTSLAARREERASPPRPPAPGRSGIARSGRGRPDPVEERPRRGGGRPRAGPSARPQALERDVDRDARHLGGPWPRRGRDALRHALDAELVGRGARSTRAVSIDAVGRPRHRVVLEGAEHPVPLRTARRTRASRRPAASPAIAPRGAAPARGRAASPRRALIGAPGPMNVMTGARSGVQAELLRLRDDERAGGQEVELRSVCDTSGVMAPLPPSSSIRPPSEVWVRNPMACAASWVTVRTHCGPGRSRG